ncbi:MAG TPA: dephospho-CoA kinase [Tepidisphaeraceae bacterium]|jgi:dephospho-CoA kinase|nr:dephospho-CoA kinase [Tepidisphaeraceae bacterium]
MYANKPIIGLAGGIGSGKSFVARCFADAGCHVIDSDKQVAQAYCDRQIQETLRTWWGEAAFLADGSINRRFIADAIFNDPSQRLRLERLLHPWVNAARRREMADAAQDNSIVAFVWDTPLLFEAGLAGECDFVVFIDVPPEIRLQRVQRSRGWNATELERREKLQWPLYKKRDISDYVLSNTADAALVRDQVREIIPRILAQIAQQ